MEFLLNDQKICTDQPPGMPLLDFIRYHRHLTGTKCGCREGDCGACTVLTGTALPDGSVEYRTMTSCLMPLGNAQGRHIVTVEGINPPNGGLTPVQEAMVEENGSQCGFCTVGFIMSMTTYCLEGRENTPEAAVSAMDGNICRCTGYKSIERAAARLNALLNARRDQNALVYAIDQGIVPAWFAEIPTRLAALASPLPAAVASASAVAVGGGTDVYVQRPEAMLHAPARHLFDHPDRQGIREEGADIVIGASATVTDWMRSPVMQQYFPSLHRHLKLVSSTPIRNMATVAGNLANASPIGDLTIWLLALNARLRLRSGENVRETALRDFYTGYKTLAKSEDELIECIRFGKPLPGDLFNFEKVCKRTYLDIASVNTGIFLHTDGNLIREARVSAGGVAPIPLFLSKTSDFLKGRLLSEKETWWEEATEVLQSEISPISDVRGTAAYKRLLMRQLFHAHFIELFPAP